MLAAAPRDRLAGNSGHTPKRMQDSLEQEHEADANSSTPAKKRRILLASVRQAYRRLSSALTGFELNFAATLQDAQTLLEGEPFDMVMIGVHFDESRMFDLLQHVRTDPRYVRVPVVCFRGILVADIQGTLALTAIELACKALGAHCFFDLLAFPNDASGNAGIRSIVDGMLASESKK